MFSISALKKGAAEGNMEAIWVLATVCNLSWKLVWCGIDWQGKKQDRGGIG